LANQPTKPTLLSPSASVTSVANQTSTFQAGLLEMTSSKRTTPVSTMAQMTSRATLVGSRSALPKIQSPSAASSRAPTGRKPRNQSPQEISTDETLRTSSTASRFGASAVRNIELVTQVVAKAVHMR
jgi:hypothetical protein